MIEDFTTTIKAQLYERVSSPLLSSFIISWCGWNYKFLLVVFSGLSVQEKLVYIDLNIFPDISSRVIYGVLLPLLTSLLLIFVYPVPAEFIYKHVKINQRRLKEIQQSIDDESPLSKEQARKIRREALENQLKYESEIDSKTSENSRLKELISELQQAKAKDAEASAPEDVVAENDRKPPSDLERQPSGIDNVVLPDPKFTIDRNNKLDKRVNITMTNNKIFGGGSIVSAPSDADYVFGGDGNEVHNMKNMFFFRQASELEFLERLGLKKGVDFELINRVLSQLHSIPQAPEAEKMKVVEASGLAAWLNIGNSVASLTTNLQGVVQQLIQEGRAN